MHKVKVTRHLKEHITSLLKAAAAYNRKRGHLFSPRIIPRALPPSATHSQLTALAPLCFQ
jgi:hypothetical protein